MTLTVQSPVSTYMEPLPCLVTSLALAHASLKSQDYETLWSLLFASSQLPWVPALQMLGALVLYKGSIPNFQSGLATWEVSNSEAN